jgi:hypothetical protein
MSFSYNPLTQEDAEKERQYPLLESGTYNFEVAKATFKTSKSNNPMIELVLNVWDNHGKQYTVYDYLISTKGMNWKILNFCESVGLMKDYDQGKFNENLCVGRSGKADIVYQIGKARPEGGFYKDKNAVANYIKMEGDKKSIDKDSDDPFAGEDIPF